MNSTRLMMKRGLLKGAMIVLLLSVPLQLVASSGPYPRLGIVNGHWGFFLIIMPETYYFDHYQGSNQELKKTLQPRAIVYKVAESGEPEKDWQVEGWYEFPHNLYLSYGGKTIVRVRGQYVHEDGSYGHESLDQDLIAFYQRSGKVAGYSAAELFTDLKKGIQWEGRNHKWFHNEGDKKPSLNFHPTPEQAKLGVRHTSSSTPPTEYFELHTLEYRYRFDVNTGAILSREPYSEKTEDG